VDDPLIEEYGGNKPYTLAWQLSNGAVNPREFTNVVEAVCPHFTTHYLQMQTTDQRNVDSN